MTEGIRPLDVVVVSDDLLWATDTMNRVATGLPQLYVQDATTVLEALDQLTEAHPSVVVTGPTATLDLATNLAALRTGHPEVTVISVRDAVDAAGSETGLSEVVVLVAPSDDELVGVVHTAITPSSVPLPPHQASTGASAARGSAWQTAAHAPVGPEAMRIVAVTGAKGGVGATLVAINLARALATNARRVALVDTRQGTGDVGLLLGLSPLPDHGLDGPGIDANSIQRNLVTHADTGVHVVQGPRDGVGPMPVAELVATLIALEPHADVAVLDVPLELLVETDLTSYGVHVILVSTTETPSLKNAIVSADALHRSPLVHLAIAHPRDDRAGPDAHSVRRATRMQIDADLPFENDLVRGVSSDEPTGLADPDSKYAKAVAELARALDERVGPDGRFR